LKGGAAFVQSRDLTGSIDAVDCLLRQNGNCLYPVTALASSIVVEGKFDEIGKLGWILLARGALNAYYGT
jgi:hypothetical protein